MRHVFNIRNILYSYLEQEDPDIVLLNDLSNTNNYKIKLHGYTTRQTDVGGQYRGSCILIKSTLRHDFLTDTFSSTDFLAVKIHTLQGPIIIATTYVNPETFLPIHDFIKLFDFNHLPVFFAGDLNAKHRVWHYPTTDAHGRQLLALFNTKNLHYIGPDFYTFHSTTGKGRPDIVFGNRAAQPYHTHCTPGPNIGSDHIPLIVRLSTNPILNPEKINFRYAQANWEEFTSELDSKNLNRICEVENKNVIEIDRLWGKIFTSIRDCMVRHIPRQAYKVRRSFVPSQRTIRLQNCFRNRFQQNINRLNQVQWDLTILRNHVLASFASDRNKYWLELVKTASDKRVRDPAEFWHHIRTLKGTNNPPFTHLINSNNQKFTEPQEVIKVFYEYWNSVYYPHPVHPVALNNVNLVENWSRRHHVETQPLPRIHLASLDDDNELIAPITFEEVKTIAMRLPRKAPGSSRIGREAIRHFPDSLLTAMTILYNASLATGYFPLHFKTALVALLL